MSLKPWPAKVLGARSGSVEKNGASSMTRPRTMSGAVAATSVAMSPPDEWPETTTGSFTTLLINHTISSLFARAVYFFGSLLEPPCP